MAPNRKRPRKGNKKKENADTGDANDENAKEFREAFRSALESSGREDGTLSVSKCKRILKKLGVSISSDELREIVFGEGGEDDDEDEDLRISEQVFVSTALRLAGYAERAKRVFQLLDEDGKGLVVTEDVQRAALELGEELTEEQIEEMVAYANVSGEDGMLSSLDIERVARKVNLK